MEKSEYDYKPLLIVWKDNANSINITGKYTYPDNEKNRTLGLVGKPYPPNEIKKLHRQGKLENNSDVFVKENVALIDGVSLESCIEIAKKGSKGIMEYEIYTRLPYPYTDRKDSLVGEMKGELVYSKGRII